MPLCCCIADWGGGETGAVGCVWGVMSMFPLTAMLAFEVNSRTVSKIVVLPSCRWWVVRRIRVQRGHYRLRPKNQGRLDLYGRGHNTKTKWHKQGRAKSSVYSVCWVKPVVSTGQSWWQLSACGSVGSSTMSTLTMDPATWPPQPKPENSNTEGPQANKQPTDKE